MNQRPTILLATACAFTLGCIGHAHATNPKPANNSASAGASAMAGAAAVSGAAAIAGGGAGGAASAAGGAGGAASADGNGGSGSATSKSGNSYAIGLVPAPSMAVGTYQESWSVSLGVAAGGRSYFSETSQALFLADMFGRLGMTADAIAAACQLPAAASLPSCAGVARAGLAGPSVTVGERP